MEKWLHELRTVASNAILYVVGAKKDLNIARKVQRAEAAKYVREHGAIGVIEVSSKTGENVTLAFETAVTLLRTQHHDHNNLLALPGCP